MLRVRGNNKLTGGTKPAPLAPVILCLVHRIFWQRSTNLVNKLALLLNKYWGRMLSTFCMFFKSPSPDAKASPSPSRGEGLYRPWCDKILGTRPRMTGGRGAGFVRLLRCCTPRNDAEKNNIAFKGLDVVRQYAALLERRVQRGTRARKALAVTRQANPQGRSMIEMLGVLAIIAVLSVGGIAGYSKAMQKWKVTKAIEEYSYLIHGLMEYRNDIVKMENKSGLVNLSEQLNLLPPTWAKINASEMQDSNGETLTLYMRNDNSFQSVPRILLNVNLVSKFSQDFCRELLDNLARPLHSALLHICIYRPKSGSTDYYGDAYCDTDDKICLHSVSLAQINEDCKKCDNENEICNLAITF